MPEPSLPGPLVIALGEQTPTIAPDAYLAPNAVIAGDVTIGAESSVWFNVTLRGDVAPIRIGARSNIQDNAVLHVDAGQPCIVGDDVTIGHSAIVHGTTVGNGVTIGMGAIVLSRSRIGEGAIVAAGAVVLEDQVVPPGALVAGIPAKEKRQLDAAQRAGSMANAARYVANRRRFQAEARSAAGAQREGREQDGG